MPLAHATPHCTGRWVQLGDLSAPHQVIACLLCSASFERTQEIAEQAHRENELTLEIEFLALEGEVLLRECGE